MYKPFSWGKMDCGMMDVFPLCVAIGGMQA
jgi:hypothetical protein